MISYFKKKMGGYFFKYVPPLQQICPHSWAS